MIIFHLFNWYLFSRCSNFLYTLIICFEREVRWGLYCINAAALVKNFDSLSFLLIMTVGFVHDDFQFSVSICLMFFNRVKTLKLNKDLNIFSKTWNGLFY